MSDKFDRLRYIGYCWAKFPPDEEDIEFEDLVHHAKFQLCASSHRLAKDPIWDEYTPEEILVEYYAFLFHNSEEQARKFLQRLNGVSESDYDWILEKTEEAETHMGEGEEDNISFDPKKLGD